MMHKAILANEFTRLFSSSWIAQRVTVYENSAVVGVKLREQEGETLEEFSNRLLACKKELLAKLPLGIICNTEILNARASRDPYYGESWATSAYEGLAVLCFKKENFIHFEVFKSSGAL